MACKPPISNPQTRLSFGKIVYDQSFYPCWNVRMWKWWTMIVLRCAEQCAICVCFVASVDLLCPQRMCVDLRATGDDVILLRTGDVLAVWFSSAAGGSEGSVKQCTHTTTVLYHT